MNSTKISSFFIVLFIVISLSTFGGQIRVSEKKLMMKLNVSAEMKSPAKHYEGVCPVEVKINGIIKSSGSVKLKYQFLRSDGVLTRLTDVLFNGRDSKTIPFIWKINNNFKGWVQLLVKLPKGEVKSNQFHFDVKCYKKQVFLKLPVRIGSAIIKSSIIPQAFLSNSKLKTTKVSDLTVKMLYAVPNPAYRNDIVTLKTKISNICNYREKSSNPCKLNYIVYLDIKQINMHHYGDRWLEWINEVIDIPSIGSTNSIWVHLQYKFQFETAYKIVVKIDSNYDVNEINERNNKKTYIFSIWKH